MMSRKACFAALGCGLFFFIFFLPPNVQAHAPRDIDMAYDFPTQTLTVTFEHWAVTPSVHFVEKVEILKNGKSVLVKKYENQPDTEKFSYTYKIEAADGDVLQVKAACSVFGVQTARLKVKKPKDEVKVIPAPAEEKKEAPAPAVEKKDEVKAAPAPAEEKKEAPAPAVEKKEAPAEQEAK